MNWIKMNERGTGEAKDIMDKNETLKGMEKWW